MNKFLLAILFFLTTQAVGQRVYSPSVDGVPGRNQPIGMSGLPIDGRSMYRDTTVSPSKWRDFQNTTEVNSYFNTGTKRQGGFVVFIHNGGTLSSGVWTGGTRSTYWYKDGVADGDLVLLNPSVDFSTYTNVTRFLDSISAVKALITSGVGGALNVNSQKLSGNGTTAPLDVRTALINEGAAALQKFLAYGDSMTEGTGVPQPGFNTGTPYMYYVQMATGWDYENLGIAGQTTDQIKTRFDADAARHYYPHIFFTGTNDGLCDWVNIIAKVQRMVDSLKHQRYLVIIPPGFSDTVYWQGGQSYECWRLLDSAMVARFGGKAIRLKQALMAAAVPNSPDTFYTNRGVWPARLGVDIVHLNDIGEKIMAGLVAAKIDTLSIKKVDERVLSNTTLAQMKSMFGDGLLRAKYTVLGSNSIQPAILPNGGNTFRTQPLTVNGGVSLLTPNGNGGLDIRPRFQDQGGFSNFEIAGTNPAVWPILNPGGLAWQNDSRQLTLGLSSNPVKWRQWGDQDITGVTTTLLLNAQTGINIFSGGIHNKGEFSSATRVMDFINPGGALNGGIGLPTLYNSNEPGLFFGKRNEIFYNDDLDRIRVGHKWSGNTALTDFRSLAYLDDIRQPVYRNGGGIGLVISGDTVTISNPLAPVPAKITVTGGQTFEDVPDNSGGNHYAPFAVDGNLGTYYASAGGNGGNYMGVNFGSAYTITKVRYKGQDGAEFNNSKIQGSNTSSTSGYVDLFTIAPGSYSAYGWNEATITSTVPYRYIRITQSPGSYAMYIQEIEFYGYQSNALTAQSGSSLTYNDSTKVIGQTPDATHRWLTDAMIARWDSSLVHVVGSSDTLWAIFKRHNNLSPDSLGLSGASGVSGGSGTGTITSIAVGNLANLATASVATSTTTPSVTYSMIQPTAHTFFGNNTGSTTAPSYVSLDTADVASFGIKVKALMSSVVAAQIHDSLGTPQTFRNAQRASYDTITRTVGTVTTFKSFAFQVPAGWSYTNLSTDTTFGGAMTQNAAAYEGEDIEEKTASFTLTIAEGRIQNKKFRGSSGQTVTFPTTSDADGMVVWLTNETGNIMSLGGITYLRQNSATTITQVDANSTYKCIKKRGGTEWWVTKM